MTSPERRKGSGAEEIAAFLRENGFPHAEKDGRSRIEGVVGWVIEAVDVTD